jgi:hypothetical protein
VSFFAAAPHSAQNDDPPQSRVVAEFQSMVLVRAIFTSKDDTIYSPRRS